MQLIEARVRTRVHPDELAEKVGKIVVASDYNVLLTGPARIIAPDGNVMAVFLPGVLAAEMDAALPVLEKVKVLTDNRGAASGSPREIRGDQKRSRSRKVISSTLGAVDPGPSVSRTSGRLPACRQTAWTGAHPDEWASLRPVMQAISKQFALHVPSRYAAQMEMVRSTHPDWVIPDTPFTTVTVNNTYSTGVHKDSGDYKPGFSTLATAVTGEMTGGVLVLAEYRLGVAMGHGDLLLFDPHNWHGNTEMYCPHAEGPLERPCKEGCQRISLVSYFRTKVQRCDSFAAEQEKALAAMQT